MSSCQQKRCGGAVDSRQAQRRSRLLPSGTRGASQTEPTDHEESGTLSFQPAGEEVIDLTGESSEPEVIVISDDESAVDREQSQQQPHLSRTSENSAELLARDDEEEPRDIDDEWLSEYHPPVWMEEDSENREQNQQHPRVFRASENSAELLARDDEEEPRNNDSAWPAGPARPPTREDDNSEDWEQSQQHSPFFRTSDNSAELPARDYEEEPRNDHGGWPDSVYIARFWMHYYSEWWYLRRQPRFVRAEDNSAVLVMDDNEEEQGDDDEYRRENVSLSAQPAGLASPPTSEDDNSELLEATSSHEHMVGSGIGAGANGVHVAHSAPAELGSDEEETACSNAQQGVVIRCPICMEFYSEIVQSERMIVSTLCGHIFCSRCLPIALEATSMCPTCRMDLGPELYHPIYI